MGVLFRRSRALRAVALSSLGGAFAASLAACGGGGTAGQSSLPRVQPSPTTPAQTQSAKTASVVFTIQWPAASAASAHRTRNYLSPSTKSITIAGTGFATVEVDNPNINSSATPSPTTTQTVLAPVGTDSFSVTDYDATGAKGNVLGANTVQFTVVIDQANVVPLTLNGNLGKIACAPIAPFVSGTSSALVLTGPAGGVAVEPEDADGNIIVAPGAVPALTLSATATKALVTATSTANDYVVNPLAVATATTLSASGTNLSGATVTGTCTITRDLAMYVANHGLQGASPSVSIYDVAAPASAETPTAIVSGSNTNQNQIQYPAVDNNGHLYLSNQGPEPAATYGPTIGYIDVYAPAASGNATPSSVISGLGRPTGLSVDAAGDLYSVQSQVLNEYGPNPTATSAPINVINYYAATGGTNLELGDEDCYGNFVDASFTIYVACENQMFTYAKGSTGTVMPTTTLLAPLGNETFSSQSWLGVAADGSGNIYLPASNNNLDLISEYAAAATGAATPSGTSKATYSQPWDVFIDTAGAVYVTNFGSSTVDVFSSTTLEKTGVPTASITTGVSSPYGVTVE